MVHKPYFQEAVLLSFLRRCHSVWSHIIQIFLSQMFDVVFELPVASVLFFRTVPRFFSQKDTNWHYDVQNGFFR